MYNFIEVLLASCLSMLKQGKGRVGLYKSANWDLEKYKIDF